MSRRKLLKSQERRAVFGLPTDDDSLIRHYTLSPNLLEIRIRRRPPSYSFARTEYLHQAVVGGFLMKPSQLSSWTQTEQRFTLRVLSAIGERGLWLLQIAARSGEAGWFAAMRLLLQRGGRRRAFHRRINNYADSWHRHRESCVGYRHRSVFALGTRFRTARLGHD
jgi:hypothetical protein